jgi:hypothetical protein
LGHSYSYTVTAVNGLVVSPASGAASVAFVAPALPAALVATATTVSGTRNNVALSWAAAAPGETYTVQRIAPASQGGGTTTLLTNSTATSFNDLNVRRATAPYTYQIRTNNGPLSSAYVQTVVVVNN